MTYESSLFYFLVMSPICHYDFIFVCLGREGWEGIHHRARKKEMAFGFRAIASIIGYGR